MKTIKLNLLLLLIVSITSISCGIDDGDNYCYSEVGAPAIAVTGETETLVNEEIKLDVSFNLYSKCGRFLRFNETTSFPKRIIIVAAYEGCQCEQETIVKKETYTFKADKPGDYILRFATEKEDITHTITVTE